MALLYSKQFIAGSAAPGAALNAVVPTGHIWVVRSIDIQTTVTGVTAVSVSIPGVAVIFRAVPPANFSSVTWQGRQVLNAGETLNAGSVGGAAFFMVSGYELTTP
jgi:hypothetical protein